MSLNSSLTSLADSVRKISFNSGVKYSIDSMATVLNNWYLFRSEFPQLSDNNGQLSVTDGNAQKFTISGNYVQNIFINNWAYINLLADVGTNIKQAMTVETDGTVNYIDLLTYNASKGDQGTVVSKYMTKVADNTYRVYISANNKIRNVVEPFNFNVNISNGTYIKFSEPYFSIEGNNS